MKSTYQKYHILSLLLLCCTLNGAAQHKEWTYLVYIAGDNNLEPFIDRDIKEMRRVGTNEHINVLAYVNAHRPGQDKTTEKFVVYYHDQQLDGKVESRDSGVEDTFMDALVWAHTNYPSDHFAVVLWDHGSGPLNRSDALSLRGICYDDTTGHYLTDRNMYNVLEQFCTQYRDGKKIDIIAFDACVMGHLEIAFTVQPWADYMVGSQENIPGNGNEYYQVLKPFKYGSLNAYDFAKRMVYAFAKTYKTSTHWQSFTLSAIDLSLLDPVVQSNNRVAQLLKRYMKRERKHEISDVLSLATSPGLCPQFSNKNYIDLYSLYENLLLLIDQMNLKPYQMEKLSTALHTAMNALKQCIIREAHGTEHKDVHGLSIYFPLRHIDRSYYNLYWSEYTRWLKLYKKI